VHDGHAASAAGCRYRMLYVATSAIETALDGESSRQDSIDALRGPQLEDPALARLFHACHRTLDVETPREADELEAQSRLIELLSSFFARHGEHGVRLRRGAESRSVARAKEYLAARLDERIGLTELAALVGRSPCFPA
jgi:hypothetical protein